ncbi:hypothetical protein HQ520_11505 [bacterium]|nr:hypothetical protein [bacterium]
METIHLRPSRLRAYLSHCVTMTLLAVILLVCFSFSEGPGRAWQVFVANFWLVLIIYYLCAVPMILRVPAREYAFDPTDGTVTAFDLIQTGVNLQEIGTFRIRDVDLRRSSLCAGGLRFWRPPLLRLKDGRKISPHPAYYPRKDLRRFVDAVKEAIAREACADGADATGN